ncbi:MAG: rhodanese-related sulfurtransferase [Planctomycetota bacterium]|jgi:rhodanese-related sulfurtransferase
METITASELKERQQNGEDLHLINVLPAVSFKKQHLRGSINISAYNEDFLDRIAALVSDQADTLVLYCLTKSCNASSKAAQRLDQAGYTQVFDFEGGVKEWLAAGYAI